jgi:hypothetical protein
MLRASVRSGQKEVLLGDDICSCAVYAEQHDAMPIDGDQRVNSEIDNSHATRESRGGDPKPRNIKKVLPAISWISIETDDDVMTEACGEHECVVSGPAVHRVIASTTDDHVVATAGVNDIITTLAIDHVTVAVEGNIVIALATDDILDATEAVAADLTTDCTSGGDYGTGAGQV